MLYIQNICTQIHTRKQWKMKTLQTLNINDLAFKHEIKEMNRYLISTWKRNNLYESSLRNKGKRTEGKGS